MRRQILVKVWQGKLSPEKALNLLQDEAIRDGRNKFSGLDERVLHCLKAVREKAITVNEAEEEIEEGEEWIRTKIKAGIRKPQTEKSCCA